MKKTVILILAIILGVTVSAQTPQSFRYQAVARDNSGNILANQSVSFRISILSGSVSGTISYSETHTGLTTNAFGLVELEIGKGTPITGTFSAINWGNKSFFVKIEMDPAGGIAYQVLSTSQLLSVPYALHANTVQTGDNWGTDTVNTDATLTGNGTAVTPLKIAGNGVNSSKILDGSIVSADLANAAVTTAKLGNLVLSTEKIQNGAVNSDKLANNSVTTEKISAGAITGDKIFQAGATSGQALKWSGTTWTPADDAIALPFSGTGTSESPLFDITNLGTSGAISTFSSGNYGIWGESGSSSGIGIYGVNKISSGTTYGVFGDVYSPTGFSGFFQGGKFYIKGNTGIGTQDPSAKLEVSGQVKITGGSPGTGKVLTSDGFGLATWQTPEVNLWLKNSNNIYYNAGNVGIGLNNPAGMLEIYGNSIDSYPQLLLSETDGFARVSFKTMLASSKHWVLAGHTNQTDGDSQWHLNYFNGSVGKNIFSVFGNSNISFDGKVGIGTTVPGTLLQVHSNITYAKNVTPIIRISDNYKTWNIGLGDPGDRFSITSEDYTERLTILKSNGFVGLGTAAPSAGLHIKANSWPGSFIYLESNSGSDAGVRFYEGTTPQWHIYNNAAAGGLKITNGAAQTAIFAKQVNAFVGIGTSNPEYILDVAGGINIMKGVSGAALLCNGSQAIWYNGTYFSWGYQGTYNYFANKVTIGNAANPVYMLYVQGNAYTTGTWSSSDIRFKKNVSSIENALSGILKIRGTSFEFRKNKFKNYQFDEGTQFGFIAQELENVFPEVVNTEPDGYKSVNYSGMIPLLVEAIKEQQKGIEKLKTENESLKAENEKVKDRLEKLEALLNATVKK